MKKTVYFLLLTLLIPLLAACSGKTETIARLAETNEEAISYTDRAVDSDDIERLLEVAAATPCSRQVAPWQFYTLQGPAISKLKGIGTLGDGLRNATAAIMVCGVSSRFGEGDARALWQQDCAAAVQNIILTARAMGLTPNVIHVYPMQQKVKAVKSAFDLDPAIVPFSVIALGEAEETKVIPPVANQPKPESLK